MSCHEYRYLIQHRFDEDLDADEAGSLDDHIEGCESCAKFEHQLDQMIQGAEEMPLPEELAPPNPEALAKMIQQQLPQQKSMVLNMLMAIFGGKEKSAVTRGSSAKKGEDGGRGEYTKRGAKSEKRSRAPVMDEDEAGVISSRLKAVAPKDPYDSQATTTGLGQKFGIQTGNIVQQDAATPLTLAESIRRKISESQKISVNDDAFGDLTESMTADDKSEDKWSVPTPIKVPGAQGADAPSWAQGDAQKAGSWANKQADVPGAPPPGGTAENIKPQMAGAPQGGMPGGALMPSGTPMTGGTPMAGPGPGGAPQGSTTGGATHPGSAIGLAPPGAPGAPPSKGTQDNWDNRPPRGTLAEDEGEGWGPPPAGGSWEEPGGSNQAPAAPAQAPSSMPWASQSHQPSPGSSWSSNTLSTQTPPSPAPSQAAPPVSTPGSSWSSPQPGASWGAPTAPVPGGPSTPASSPTPPSPSAPPAQDSWGSPPSPPQPVTPQGVASSWGQIQSDQFQSGSWTTPSAKDGQTSGKPIAPANPSAAQDWGGGPTGGSVSSWGALPNKQASDSQPASPASGFQSGAWGGGDAQSGNWGASGTWSTPQAGGAPKTTSENARVPQAQEPGWGQKPQTQDSAWGSTPGKQDAWSSAPGGAGAGAGGSCGQVTPQAAENARPAKDSWTQTPPDQSAPDSWGKTPLESSSGWGTPPQPAAPAPGQTKDSSWGTLPGAEQKSADAGWGTPPQATDTKAGGWGTPATPKSETPASSAGWGVPTSSSSSSWGTPPQQQEPVAQAPADTNKGWGTPITQSAGWGTPTPPQSQPQEQPAGQQDGWSVPKVSDKTGWGSESGDQGWSANKPQQPAENARAQASQGSWGTGAPADAAKAGWGSEPAKPEADPGNWSIEAEQMETGSWRAFAPASSDAALTAPQQAPPSTTAFDPMSELSGDRWDKPIQERPQGAAVQNDRFDTPIQERVKQDAGTDSSWSTPVQQMAQAAPQSPAAGRGQTPSHQATTSFADKKADNHWDLTIQEKMKMQAGAQAAQSLSSPDAPQMQAPPQATTPSFGTPPQPPTGAPPPFGAAPAGFGAPGAPPAFGTPPAPQAPAFGTPPAFGAPPAPSPAGSAPGAPQSSLFGKTFDDQAIDQIYENLGIPSTPPDAPQQAAPATQPQPAVIKSTPPPAPPAPAAGAAPAGWGVQPAPATPSSGDFASGDLRTAPAGWGAPSAPAPAARSDMLSFAPPGGAPQAEAPKLTAIPPKSPTGDVTPPFASQPAPPSAPMPPSAPAVPAPQAAPPALKGPQPASGIFQLDDAAVDQIFSKMGVDEKSIPVNQAPGAAPPAVPGPLPPGIPGSENAPLPPPMPPQAPASGAPPAFGGMTPPAGWSPISQPRTPPTAGFPAPQPQAPLPPQMPPPPKVPGALFQVDDADMDNLFDKVLINPAQETNTRIGGQVNQPASVPPPTNPFGAPPNTNGQYPPAPPAPAPMAPPQPPVGEPPSPSAVAHVPLASGPPPKIEGIGKLDAGTEVAETGSGRIAAIGKFLLDQKDIEKLSKITAADQQDIKMRILTLEASEDLQTLLSEIGSQEKVIGSVIVGHDGLLIANTMPEEVDAESIGVWALGVYMNTEHVTKKMGHERVHQVVSRTPRGYVVIADFGGGLLVTITDGTDTDTLIPLMRKITDLVS